MGSALKKNPLTRGIESDYELNIATAKQVELDSQYNAAQRRKAADLLSAEQARNFGANNIEVSGSALQAIQEDQVIAEIEAMNEIYSGRFKASSLKKQAKNQKNSAYLGLGTQALMSASGAGLFAGAASKLNSSGSGSATLNEVSQSKTSAKNYSGSSNRNLS